jgi:hypothetical protein
MTTREETGIMKSETPVEIAKAVRKPVSSYVCHQLKVTNDVKSINTCLIKASAAAMLGKRGP